MGAGRQRRKATRPAVVVVSLAAVFVAAAVFAAGRGDSAATIDGVSLAQLDTEQQPEPEPEPEPLPPLGWGYSVAVAKDNGNNLFVHGSVPAAASIDAAVSDRYQEWAFFHLPRRSPTAEGLSHLPGERNIAGRYRTEGGWGLENPTPYGNLPVLLVLEDHGDWLAVQVPSRPAGAVGWVPRAAVDVEERDVRVEVSISAASLTVYAGDDAVFNTSVVVGAPHSPTPTGRFYITHHEHTRPGDAYGGNILGLDGYSETLESFSNGAPGLALHGTNAPHLAGRAVSNGCVRVPDIETVVSLTGPGTVVDIHP